MEWHPKPISWASENKLLEPSSLDRILRQLLVPTLFAGAGGQRRHPSRGWQVQLELQVSGVTSPSYPGHSLQFWSKTQRFPFGTFQLLKVTWQSLWWQSLAAVRSRWQKTLGCRHFSCVQTQFWQIWWQLPTSHWQVSNRPLTREVTSMQIQVSRSEKSWRFFGRNQVDRMTTAVDGVAYGWELTGSVEG